MEFSDWVENAATVLERLGSADNVVVGSSMGGWISLILASQEQPWHGLFILLFFLFNFWDLSFFYEREGIL